MTDRVSVGNLRVAQVLYDFVNNEALPGTDIDPDSFWAGVDKVVTDLQPQNQDLLARRDQLQAQIDKYHRQHVIEPLDPDGYREFLTEIGYLQPEPADFTITTAGVDDEITTTAGPQLVVPVLNARFALNASNARWGSLYDALYGTDVIPEERRRREGHQLQPGPRRQGHRLRAQVPRRGGSAVVGLMGRHHRAQPRGRSAAGRDRRRLGWPRRPGEVRRLHRRARLARLVGAAGQPRPAPRDPDRPRVARRQDRRGRHQGRRAGVGDHHDHGLRGLGRRRRRRRQGAGLPQLARPEPGRPVRRGRQGRQDLPPGCSTRTAPTRHPTAAS